MRKLRRSALALAFLGTVFPRSGAIAQSVIQDGNFLQPIGTGSNQTPWSDWTNAGVTRQTAPAGIPGNYASLPVGADLFQDFSTLPPGSYTLSFLVQNPSPGSADLVFAVQQALGTHANVLTAAGTEWILTLPESSNFVSESFNFTIGALPFVPDEFYFSNSYDYPQPGTPIANSINPAGTILNVADVSLTAGVSLNCFFRGTKILTSKGEVAVERLSIGDCVITVDSRSLPIRWIGRQRFTEPENGQWPRSILPVKISRHAIDDQTPHSDLYVSPSHALYIDGVLIPAIHLVNGSSIVQAMPEWAQDIDLFHIELETHEVIFAEAAPAETFLVGSDREAFDNFIEYERLYGHESRPAMTPFAPIACYNGGVSELDGFLRRVVSSVVAIDMRNPIQIAYDRIAARGLETVA